MNKLNLNTGKPFAVVNICVLRFMASNLVTTKRLTEYQYTCYKYKRRTKKVEKMNSHETI